MQPSCSCLHTRSSFEPTVVFHFQDQLIAELERLQLEVDQLRARPGGSYSRSVRHKQKVCHTIKQRWSFYLSTWKLLNQLYETHNGVLEPLYMEIKRSTFPLEKYKNFLETRRKFQSLKSGKFGRKKLETLSLILKFPWKGLEISGFEKSKICEKNSD